MSGQNILTKKKRNKKCQKKKIKNANVKTARNYVTAKKKNAVANPPIAINKNPPIGGFFYSSIEEYSQKPSFVSQRAVVPSLIK